MQAQVNNISHICIDIMIDIRGTAANGTNAAGYRYRAARRCGCVGGRACNNAPGSGCRPATVTELPLSELYAPSGRLVLS